MSTATIQQIGQDLTGWLGFVRRGETVAITEQGHIVAHLTPPNAADVTPAVAPKGSMEEWLSIQDARMQRAFGNNIVADSAAMLDDLRADRE
jgi:antitoxin (DNA-binding transcriptional repressor) of toxin-antitoxin stability system